MRARGWRDDPWGRLDGPASRLLLFLLVFPVGLLHAQDPGSDLADRIRPIQDTVLGANPGLEAARASLESAESRLEGAGLAPPLVLSGEIDDVPDGYDVGGATARFEVGREFLTGGRSAAARALEAANVSSASARLEVLERQIRSEVLREIAVLATAAARADLLATQDTLLSSADEIVRDRFSVGEARYVEILRVRTARLRAQAERSSALAEERGARQRLLGLVVPEARGDLAEQIEAPAVALAITGSASLPPVPSVDSLLRSSAPVRVARARLERARSLAAEAVAETRPRIAGSIGLQRSVESGGDVSLGPVVGGSVTLPFTAGRANASSRRAANQAQAAAERSLEAERERVRGLLSAEVGDYEAALERLVIFDQALLVSAREARENALAVDAKKVVH